MANEEALLVHTIHKKGEKMMTKIKKLAMILLLIVTSVFSAGCNCGYLVWPGGFFCKEILKQCWVSDLPQLSHGQGTYTSYKEFYTNLTKEEYMTYVEKVYTYLVNKNFYFLGYEGESLGSGWGIDSYNSYRGNELMDFYKEYNSKDNCEEFHFIWLQGKPDGSYKFPWSSLKICFNEQSFKKRNNKCYNVVLILNNPRHSNKTYNIYEN